MFGIFEILSLEIHMIFGKENKWPLAEFYSQITIQPKLLLFSF